MAIRWPLGILLAVALGATAASGDEAALRRRIEELEQQQRMFQEQLRLLREELRQEKVPAVAAPAAPAPAPAPVVAPAPAVVAPPAVAQPPPAAPSPVVAAPGATPAPAGVEEVQRRQEILTEEVRKIREWLVLPETQELKGRYGLGPAASKVYIVERGLAIGGYGETNFKAVTAHGNGAKNTFDFVRLVAYLGYKFTPKLVFNSEIEFEHALTGESTVSADSGEVRVEFATLDYLWHPIANARAGLMLMPVGFINEVHEPPFYLGNTRPPVETQIIPTTWSANGFGLFGEILPNLQYKVYGVTSLNALGYHTLNIRDARQSGNREVADSWSFVGRIDYAPMPEYSFGGSAFVGDQGQNEEYAGKKVGVFSQLYEIHAQVQTRGLWFRALGTQMLVDDAGLVSLQNGQPVGEIMLGAYAEVAYNLVPLLFPESSQYLAPWYRYSWLDTNNKVRTGAGFPARNPLARRWYNEFGLQYKPIPQVVLKADYHIQDSGAGSLPYEMRVGGGFVF